MNKYKANKAAENIMQKKEIISNNCQLCEYSAKQYVYVKNKCISTKAAFCMSTNLTSKEKQRRMNDKKNCEYFKLAKANEKEQLSDIRVILKEINTELKVIEQMLSDINQ